MRKISLLIALALIIVNLGYSSTFYVYLCTGNPDEDICSEVSNAISYSWNTGQTTECINVSTTGTYVCTAVTRGGNVITTHIVREFDDPEIVTDYCSGALMFVADDTYAQYGYNHNSYDSYLWNTGATTFNIPVSANNTYYVTVTAGNCSAVKSKHIGDVVTLPTSITSDVAYNNDALIVINNDVTVDDGAPNTHTTLNLSYCNVRTAPDKSLIIQGGDDDNYNNLIAFHDNFDGQCIINNANTWQSIRLNGTNNYSTAPICFDELNIQYSTIKNANRAVEINHSAFFGITNTNFYNNIESIYCNTFTGHRHCAPNIDDCIFEVNNNHIYYYGNFNYNYQISFLGFQRVVLIQGIRVHDYADLVMHLNGMYFYDAYPPILRNYYSINSEFENLNYALYIDNCLGTLNNYYTDYTNNLYASYLNGISTAIHNCTFTDNIYGIYQDDAMTSNIYDNDFVRNYAGVLCEDVDVLSFDGNTFDDLNLNHTMNNYQLMIRGCDNPEVTLNEFNNGVAGIVVEDGTGDYQLYKNTFTGFDDYGAAPDGYPSCVIAQGVNGNYESGSSAEGLEVKCNWFEDYSYAISLMSGTMKRKQGKDISYDISAPANNDFEGTSYETEGQFYVDGDVADYIPGPPSGPNHQFKYYYPSLPTTGNHAKLEHYTQYYNNGWPGRIVPVSVPESGNFIYANSCPDTPGSRGGRSSKSSFSDLSNVIRNLNIEISNKQAALNSKIDSGNTAQLLSEINMTNSNNFNQLFTKLENADSYLSDDVLLQFMQKDYGHPTAKIGVLVANSPLSDAVQDEIDNLSVNENLKELLKTYQTGVSDKEKDENEIANLCWQKNNAIQQGLRHILSDSLQTGFDDLLTLMTNQDEWHYKTKAVKLMAKTGRNTQAENEIQEMRQELPDFDQEKQDYYNNYLNLMEFYMDIKDQDTSSRKSEIIQNQQWLSEIADTNRYADGKVLAKLLLKEAGLIEFKDSVRLPNPNNSNKNVQVSGNNHVNLVNAENFIKLHPNPVKDNLTVEYVIYDDVQLQNIGIYNIKGELVKSVKVNSNVGFVNINVQDLPNGNYILGFGTDGLKGYNKKFIKE